MKPRLYFRRCVWACVSIGDGDCPPWMRIRAGYGYTPIEAYQEWMKQ